MSIHPTIPSLDEVTAVNPTHARQDRIVLELGEWQRFGSAQELTDFVGNLGLAEVADSDGVLYRGLGTPRGRMGNVFPIFKGGRGQSQSIDNPLIRGELVVRDIRDARGIIGKSVKAKLTINPTRFVNYQYPPSRGADGEYAVNPETAFMRHPTPAMQVFGARSGPLDERVLVLEDHRYSDNVIIGPTRFLLHCRPSIWRSNVTRYWTTLIRMLHEVVGDNGQASFLPDLKLISTETYFEFHHPEPIYAMRTLEDAARARHNNVLVTLYPLNRISTGVEGNSPCIKVRKSKGTSLRLYAKTSRRIRFEVTFKPRYITGPLGRHTSGHLTDLLVWLNHHAHCAAIEVNDFLSAIHTMNLPAIEEATPASLVRHVINACNGTSFAGHVLEQLVIVERLVIFPGDPLKSVRETLTRLGVLQHNSRRGRDLGHTLSPRFRAAALQLQQVLFPNIGNIRSRSRPPVG